MKKLVIVAAAIATFASFQAEARDAKEIYTKTCSMCHATGAANAPIAHNADAWKPRLAKGVPTLLKNAKSGFNAMPPMGMCADCTDAEIKSVIDFMSKPKK